MRQTRCLGKTIARGAVKHILNRRFETEAMADRNKNWFHTNARAQHRTDNFATVPKRAPRPLLIWNFAMRADETRFGDADAG